MDHFIAEIQAFHADSTVDSQEQLMYFPGLAAQDAAVLNELIAQLYAIDAHATVQSENQLGNLFSTFAAQRAPSRFLSIAAVILSHATDYSA
jgi:hypothetical protein